MIVKLSSARVGHNFNDKGQFTGMFAQAAGEEVEMSEAEGRRYIERGLGTEVKKSNKN